MKRLAAYDSLPDWPKPPPTAVVDDTPLLRWTMRPTAYPHPVDGDYVRDWYMARLGPSTTALLQLLARNSNGDKLSVLPLHDIATRLGLASSSRRDTMRKSIDRLVKFAGVTKRDDGVLVIPTHVPPIGRLDFDRMVPARRAEYDRLFS